MVARKLLPNLKPIPFALVIRYGGDLFQNLGTCRIGCEVGLDFYERAERASNDHNFLAIHIPSIALHIFRVIT